MALNMASGVAKKGHLRIAVDIGGTFTDLAVLDETNGELSFGKALSTHGKLVDGIQNTLDGAKAKVGEGYLFLGKLAHYVVQAIIRDICQ